MSIIFSSALEAKVTDHESHAEARRRAILLMLSLAAPLVAANIVLLGDAITQTKMPGRKE
jgi:hypothetical protein